MDEEYQLEYFSANGFARRICTSCGSPFWTQGDSTLCGDTPCVEYGFIGRPLMDHRYDLREMREAFLGFFGERGHTRLERYPVIARWRKDIYLTIASIADFQPHSTSGEVPPPANPLVISQPCIRLNDLDSVGKSGRHLSCFEMMGHHAFNSERLGEIYWKEKTVEYCHEFMTTTLGMKGEDLTYKENPWTGGGNAGPALEVMNAGLEVATLVFMGYIQDDEGTVTLKGDTFAPMDIRIVDTGYGLERLVWASDGSPTLYDSIFPDITKKVFGATGLDKVLVSGKNRRILEEHVKLCGILDVSSESKLVHLRTQLAEKLAGKGIDVTPADLQTLLEPIENAYTLIDHCRALTFMFTDGVVPSNVKAGYLARLILRRCLRIIEDDGIPFTLQDIVGMHIDSLEEYPELTAARDRIMYILELETRRYGETLVKGTNILESFAKTEKLRKLANRSLIARSATAKLMERLTNKAVVVRLPLDDGAGYRVRLAAEDSVGGLSDNEVILKLLSRKEVSDEVKDHAVETAVYGDRSQPMEYRNVREDLADRELRGDGGEVQAVEDMVDQIILEFMKSEVPVELTDGKAREGLVHRKGDPEIDREVMVALARRVVEDHLEAIAGRAGAVDGGGDLTGLGDLIVPRLPEERLIDFYDSQGLHPSIVKRVAEAKGLKVDIPDNFFSMVAGRHGTEKKEKEARVVTYDVEPTRKLYYEDEHMSEFDAAVLAVDGPKVVLDVTAFYPEGGGQPADHGVISSADGGTVVNVTDVQKARDTVVHITDTDPAPFSVGDKVRGRLDWGRRIAHMRHHTATHIMLSAARQVLGDHVWQAGAQKTADRARLDIAHYERITPEQVAAMERRANEIILSNFQVDSKWHKRDYAEKTYGQQLYQGGVPAGEDVRVVRIPEIDDGKPDIDVEACAGTHTASTQEVGSIKIIHTERLQDGVERLEYSAGLAAVEANQARDRLIRESAEALSVMPEQLPKTASRFFDEWKALRKKVDELEGRMAGDVTGTLLAAAEAVKADTGGVRVVAHAVEMDMKALQALSKELCANDNVVAILGGKGKSASFIVSRSPDVKLHCGEAVKVACETAGGKGGGRPDFAQGGGPDGSKVDEGVEKAREWVVGQLSQ